MCCIEEASSGQVPKQTFSVIVAFIGCLDLSRFICSINNFMCPLIISPLFLKANARAQLTTISISWGRISLIHESPSSRSDQFYSRAIPDFCQVVKDVLVMFFRLSQLWPPTIHTGSLPQPFPSDPYCRPFPATRIPPTKEFTVCTSPELFCRPFPSVNSL